MHWLLIGYMFLFIDRPFEVWPVLGDWHIERAYMVVTMLAWLVYPNKRILMNRIHIGIAGLAVAVVASWLMSPWLDAGQPRVEDWFKILVFYVLLVTTVHDERGLKTIVVGFLAVMGLYLLHSLKEYIGGRFTYRMGISRMIGVDTSLGDPNSFGATIVFALPFVAAFWKMGFGGKPGRVVLAGYFLLSVLCLLLTGSRSSLIGLVFWCLGMVFFSPHRWKLMPVLLIAAPIAFVALPDSLQNRFETIIDSDVGPANAKTSGEGRIEGLIKGFELWGYYPLTGAGPGTWRPATKSSIESHSLPGQLVGELGLLGLCAFGLYLLMVASNLRAVNSLHRESVEEEPDFSVHVSRAVGIGVLLLLFMGLFGHNLFRFSWLWYAGFLVVARFVKGESLLDEWETTTIHTHSLRWHEDDEPIVVELIESQE